MVPGSTIAHYRVTSKLGEGGMGEVFRAVDTKLNREVAIKVLPEILAADPDRHARFTREAQVLASLNHPNIAAIYGVEDRALVMELVEGATMEERIGQGAIPVEEALPMARQIAEALEYAHERGIVHRDLKPANLKLTPEGRVKVLDFGLAKALAADLAAGAPGSSPTLTMRATAMGQIMGTAGYMSPEQAKGKPVDRRADIWAFGVVLVEMLTGRLLYSAETVSETLAAVIRDEPDLSRLPADTPPSIRRLLRRCLEKDPQRRLQSIGEARIAIDDAKTAEPAAVIAPAASSRPGASKAMAAAAGVSILAAAILGGLLWRATRPVPRPLRQFSVDLGPEAVIGLRGTLAVSPDGSRIAYHVRGPGGGQMLAVRSLDQRQGTVLAGTEDGSLPFFSPDSQWLGFFAAGSLKKIAVQGGPPVTLCEASNGRGASWGDDGNIVAALEQTVGLSRVPGTGGTPQPVTNPADKGQASHRWPQVLPGSQAAIFSVGKSPEAWEDGAIEVVSLKTGQSRTLVSGGYFGRYLPSGHLVYLRAGTLFAVGFDANRLEVQGSPVPVVQEVSGHAASGGGHFDFSGDGTLVYLSGKSDSAGWPLLMIDSTGKSRPLPFPPSSYGSPRFSPDGRQLAVSIARDIWVMDLQREARLKVTSRPSVGRYPIWAPDAKHLVYSTSEPQRSRIFWMRADGSGEPQMLREAVKTQLATSVSPDGRWLSVTETIDPDGSRAVVVPLDLSDPDHPRAGAAVPLPDSRRDTDGEFSPDGHWISFTSAQSGLNEVFVRPLRRPPAPPVPALGKYQVSVGGGRNSRWSRTGKQIFYTDESWNLMVVDYTIQGDTFQAGKPRRWMEQRLMRLANNFSAFDVTPDGKRVVALPSLTTPDPSSGNLHFTFLQNFFDELKRRIP